MPFFTPLRYPGGKRRLAPVVMRLLEENNLRDIHYVEPYAGGAAIALAVLLGEYAATVHINDLSRPVYAFWHTVLNDTAELCQRIRLVRVTMAEWRRQRAVYENREKADVFDLGFATFFLNRTNRSGIIGGGVIGGKKQAGAWGIAARFGKTELIQRIRRIGRYRNRISLYQSDALAFTNDVLPGLGHNVFAFYDPPYIENGQGLYLNNYGLDDHRALAKRVAELDQPWVVTYDHASIRTGLYQPQRRIVYSLSYSAQSRVREREVMFLSDRLKLPTDWMQASAILVPRRGRRVAVYGKMENMKPATGMEEGPAAFQRFRKAMKAIVSVPKDSIAKDSKATAPKKTGRQGRRKR